MRKNRFFFFFLLVLLLLLPTQLWALGVGPSRVRFTYEPGFSYEHEVCFYPQSNAYLQIDLGGDFSENVKILSGVDERMRKYVTPEDRCIVYRFTAPDKIDAPGLHRTVIGAKEISPDESPGQFNVLVRVEHQIDVFVPYPGKYLETSLDVTNSNAETLVPIGVSAVSRGTEVIDSAWAEVKVFGLDGKQVGRVESKKEYDLQPEGETQFKMQWDSKGYPVGKYNATSVVYYDGLNSNASDAFKLGGVDVLLISHTENVTIGGIKPFALWVESLWSEPITNVKAKVAIYNLTGREVAIDGFETLTISLPAWGAGSLQGYIDTEKTGLGEFDAVITLEYGEETKQYERRIKVIEPPKPAPEKSEWLKGLLSATTILSLLVIILIIILVIIIITVLPKKKKQDNSKRN